jgi:predicted ATP-dependent serine protease
LILISDKTNKFFICIEIKIKQKKSATKNENCKDFASLLEEKKGYKYLGIKEELKSRTKQETIIKTKKRTVTTSQNTPQNKNSV